MTFVCIAPRITVQPTRSNTFSTSAPASHELLRDYCFPMPRRVASVTPKGSRNVAVVVVILERAGEHATDLTGMRIDNRRRPAPAPRITGTTRRRPFIRFAVNRARFQSEYFVPAKGNDDFITI